MPIGILVCAASVVTGGLIGAGFGKYLNKQIIQHLPTVFSLCAITIGISLIGKMQALSPVVLALICGAVLGEWLKIEERMEKLTIKLGAMTTTSSTDDSYVRQFILLLILFCVSSTGIMGALTEGMTGDSSILLAKSVLDFFTAVIFASSMGVLIAFIAFPQLVIQLAFFFLASLIMPYVGDATLGNFMACGGIITIAAGLRMADIKQFRVTNLLPALALIIPFSNVWSRLVG